MTKKISSKEGKRVSVANFNVVFMGEEKELPLLDCFESILMPAFKSGITRTQGDTTYLLMDIEIRVDNKGDYVLTGLIVKSTILEVKSMFDADGNLIERNDVYPTAPFSTFVIYLRNHRMILVENQKGSPSLNSFRSTAKYILDSYVVIRNHSLKETNEKLLPIPLVNVTGIPPKGGIVEELKKVEKITKLTLRFYPLNGDGDLDLAGLMGGMLKDVRRRIGSDGGAVNYNSPKNINGVIEVVESAEGTVEPIIMAKYPGKTRESTIRCNEIKDRRKMFIPEGSRTEDIESIINQGVEIDSINYTSKENNKIYSKNKNKIIQFLKKEK